VNIKIPTIHPVTEASWQREVERYAESRGWDWMHVPRSKVGKRFRTMIVGTLAVGWPDLFLVRGSRAITIECKTDRGSVKPDQRRVDAILGQALECYLLRPKDRERMRSILW